MAADSIPARLLRQAALRPSGPAYHVKEGAEWRATSWAEYVAQVRAAARSLLSLGLRAGEPVCLLGFNRPEWCILDLATMAVGGAPAGIYTTSTAADVRYILEHSEARLLLLDGRAQWAKVAGALEGLPRLERVVFTRGVELPADERVLGWEQFLALGAGIDDALVDQRIAELARDSVATLIYTSGTTGTPKGVMLSQRNLCFTADVLRTVADLGPQDAMLSFLPLAHIAEQIFSIHGSVTYGVQIYFVESMEKLLENLKEVQPTLVFGVPRIWEKIQAGVAARLQSAPPAKRWLVRWAMGVARQVQARRDRGSALPALLSLEYLAAERLVLSRIKAALGLGRCRAASSGAAAIDPQVLQFLRGLDLNLLPTYGQSEATGPTTSNTLGRNRPETVGPAMAGVEVRLAEDGEILVRGPNVFLGYYKDPAATAETLVDGWLHSGDLGSLDADGFLTITGRKKEILVTSGGKNIAPTRIEGALKREGLIAEAVVIGDRRPFLTALLCLEETAARRLASRDDTPSERLGEDPAVAAAVAGLVERVNQELSRFEQVRRFTILSRALSVEQGEITPTLKVRRRVVAERFAREIEKLYEARPE
jgi:long-chain acyl-CoA synthetase